MIEGVNVESVKLPLQLRAAVQSAQARGGLDPELNLDRFEATLVFGLRLEPWLASAVYE